ncbi:DUF3800 domain-containing protein [candidate division KSB1 bacterium]|nr:DUF3800 domain-containing protein [candidate division KSB1 bacterium]
MGKELVLFLDESGDHSLIKIDDQYPMFVLAGVMMDREYHDTQAVKIMKGLKQSLFRRTDIIFHTADISRNKNGFERLKETEFRNQFYGALNNMMAELKYMIVAVAIKKHEHNKKYGLAALDPYLLSLECIVERFVFECGDNNKQGLIVAESRNSILDNELELAYLNLKIQGTRYIKATQIKERIKQFTIRDKKENLPGLQIADLVASPIGRFILKKKIKPDFEIIKNKFRKGKSEKIGGYGLVVLPKK